MMVPDTVDGARILTDEAGWVTLEPATVVRLTGGDRHAFLHNFCTADIKSLVPGSCCEAFILNPRGKVIALVQVLASEDAIRLVTPGDDGDRIVDHLDRYLIREDVELENRSAVEVCLWVAGELVPSRLQTTFGIEESKWGRQSSLQPFSGWGSGWVAHLELAGPGWLIVAGRDHQSELTAALTKASITACAPSSLEQQRVTAGTPWTGVDVDESNLPQELGRDDRAISFVKGCYLGQETVARLDALGRVNWQFVGLEADAGAMPAVGESLSVDGKAVLRITSVAPEPEGDRRLALGYARTGFHASGTVVGPVTVRELPRSQG